MFTATCSAITGGEGKGGTSCADFNLNAASSAAILCDDHPGSNDDDVDLPGSGGDDLPSCENWAHVVPLVLDGLVV